MKKISVILLVIGVCLLTACGTDDNEKSKPKRNRSSKKRN